MKEIIKRLMKWSAVLALVLATKYLDTYILHGIPEILWLICGYLSFWILD